MRIRFEHGLEMEIDDNVMDNMELVDALAEVADDDTLAVTKVCTCLLGKEKKKVLYDSLRKDGRVPVEDVSKAIMQIFMAFKEKGKN